MTDLTALIERVESGAGADRSIDGEVFIALSAECQAAGRVDHLCGVVGWWPKDGPYESARNVPAYTSSLDAVLSLIEAKLPGMSWEVRRSGFGTPSQAMIWDPMKSPPSSTIARISVETTPARALLAAALRAI
jgi:hypothetical protein